MSIGDNIKRIRTERGMSQETLGAKLGVQKSAVSKWERGVVTKFEDVERDAKMFTVRESKTAAGKNRRVPIADKVLPIVDGWLSLGYKNIAPYPNIWRQSSPDGAFRYSFKKALPDYAPHDTRYTCVSELTEAGAPAVVIRSIVGHKDANVTARYTQISDDLKLEWINALEI